MSKKEKKNSAGITSATSSKYKAVLNLWIKIHNFMMDLNLYQFPVDTFFSTSLNIYIYPYSLSSNTSCSRVY